MPELRLETHWIIIDVALFVYENNKQDIQVKLFDYILLEIDFAK